MSQDFKPAFEKLQAIMLDVVSSGLMITEEKPDSLIVKSERLDKKGQPIWFGTVAVKKSYVAYHLLTLYDHPELTEGLSAELQVRRQGKTCFNFKKADDALFAELAALTKVAREIESKA
jgi:hypothetical protein